MRQTKSEIRKNPSFSEIMKMEKKIQLLWLLSLVALCGGSSSGKTSHSIKTCHIFGTGGDTVGGLYVQRQKIKT